MTLATKDTRINPKSKLQAIGLLICSKLILNNSSPSEGWGAVDGTGQQSRYLKRVELSLNKTKDCVCKDFYFLETNVGPNNQDTCGGDSGQAMGKVKVETRW